MDERTAGAMTGSPTAKGPAAKGTDKTRELLLEAAGEVFAEKGHDGATSREICDRAGVNTAAVNYHFGGIEALYGATLTEAHNCMVRLETLAAIDSSGLDATAKLRAFIHVAVSRLMQPLETSWQLKLLSREIAAPTPNRDQLIETQILPKSRILRGIVGELIGRKPEDPAVGRALLTVVAPMLMLALADRRVLSICLPQLVDPAGETEPLIRHIERFILAGLAATAGAKPEA